MSEKWSSAPEDLPDGHDFEIVRVPASAALVGMVTSETADGLPVHYWNGPHTYTHTHTHTYTYTEKHIQIYIHIHIY